MRTNLLTAALLLLAGCTSHDKQSDGPSRSDSDTESEGTVYLRSRVWNNPYGGYTEYTWFYLSDDGVIVRNARHGMNPINPEKEKEDNEKNIGTYKERQKKLFIKWEDGKRDTFDFNRDDPSELGIDGGLVTVPNAFDDDHRIKGQFAYTSFNPMLSKVNTIVFKKNGTFELTNSTSVNVKDVTGTYGENSTSGKYKITGNTLTLKFANGNVEKSNIAYWKNDDGSLLLVINNKTFPQEGE